MKALETAVERDPSMAAAHLRLAFVRSLEAAKEGMVRSSFHAATRNRASLDERDMGLLDALEPYLQRDPSDPLEAEHRLEALRQRFPQDAEIAYVLGSVRYDRGDLAAAVEAFDAATVIDPGFAQAQSSRGGCLAYLGRWDDAHTALEAALRQSPTATEPLWYEAEIAEQQGRCADEESAARAWLARDPDDAFAYYWLASALASEGRPVDTVRTAVEQKWVREDPDERAKRQPVDRASLAVMTGDFAAAEGQLRALEAVLASEPGAQVHAEAQAMLVRIAEETGKSDQAREIATAYLARKDAWAPAHRVDDVAILMDPVPTMLGALARAGALSPAQRATQRGEWLGAWQAKTSAAFLGVLWISRLGHARGVARRRRCGGRGAHRSGWSARLRAEHRGPGGPGARVLARRPPRPGGPGATIRDGQLHGPDRQPDQHPRMARPGRGSRESGRLPRGVPGLRRGALAVGPREATLAHRRRRTNARTRSRLPLNVAAAGDELVGLGVQVR